MARGGFNNKKARRKILTIHQTGPNIVYCGEFLKPEIVSRVFGIINHMAIIKKKTWPDIFELMASGKKSFDLRVADFDIKEGDTLMLEEWNPETKEYTGRTIQKLVDHVLRFRLNDFGQKEEIEENGLFVIQLK